MVDMKRYTATALGALMLAAAPMAADALTVRFEDGGSTIDVVDNLGDDTNTALGVISTSLSGTGNGASVSVTTSVSIDASGESSLTLQANNVTAGSGGLIITASDDGFGEGADGINDSIAVLDADPISSDDNVVTASGYVDDGNVLFGTATLVGQETLADTSDDTIGSIRTTLDDPFSITTSLAFTAGSSGNSGQSKVVVAPVPVPAAGLMLLTALGGLGGAAGLRRRRKAA